MAKTPAKDSLIISLTCTLSLLLFHGAMGPAHANPTTELQQCAGISDNQQRLQCYDRISNKQAHADSQVDNFVQPREDFTGARLRVTEDQSDFTLTVDSFLTLMQNARLEGKKMIRIEGWTRQDNEYVLHIHYRKPMTLHFDFHKNSDGENFAVLQDIDAKNRSMDASQFIYIIASMNP